MVLSQKVDCVLFKSKDCSPEQKVQHSLPRPMAQTSKHDSYICLVGNSESMLTVLSNSQKALRSKTRQLCSDCALNRGAVIIRVTACTRKHAMSSSFRVF